MVFRVCVQGVIGEILALLYCWEESRSALPGRRWGGLGVGRCQCPEAWESGRGSRGLESSPGAGRGVKSEGMAHLFRVAVSCANFIRRWR